MLMPAGVLVVLMLGAIAFDLSLLFLRQREAASLANDVANDLATLAFDEPLFREAGRFELDPESAERLGRELIAISDLEDDVVALAIEVIDSDRVSVSITVEVDYVFARSIPGASDGTTVTGRSEAVASPG